MIFSDNASNKEFSVMTECKDRIYGLAKPPGEITGSPGVSLENISAFRTLTGHESVFY
jgi:hypothetical protein